MAQRQNYTANFRFMGYDNAPTIFAKRPENFVISTKQRQLTPKDVQTLANNASALHDELIQRAHQVFDHVNYLRELQNERLNGRKDVNFIQYKEGC